MLSDGCKSCFRTQNIVLFGWLEDWAGLNICPEHKSCTVATDDADPVICGNTTAAFTISVSGPSNASVCTASQGLSDNGNKTCQAVGKVCRFSGWQCESVVHHGPA